MADKTLEEIWSCFLGFVVPDSYHAVFACTEQISGVIGDIEGSDCASVAAGYFSEEQSLVFHETIEADLAVFRHNYKIIVIVCKSECSDDVVDLDLMLYQK